MSATVCHHFKYNLILILLLLFGAVMPVHADEISVAVRANKGIEHAIEKWQPTIDYLNNQIPEHNFIMVPFENNSSLNQAVSQGKFSFCLTNPASAVEHRDRYGSYPIATLVNKRQGKGYTQFGSVIFTRANRDDINTINDLSNKIFMAADELGFGGWRIAWREMLHKGLNPYTDLSIEKKDNKFRHKYIKP